MMGVAQLMALGPEHLPGIQERELRPTETHSAPAHVPRPSADMVVVVMAGALARRLRRHGENRQLQLQVRAPMMGGDIRRELLVHTMLRHLEPASGDQALVRSTRPHLAPTRHQRLQLHPRPRLEAGTEDGAETWRLPQERAHRHRPRLVATTERRLLERTAELRRLLRQAGRGTRTTIRCKSEKGDWLCDVYLAL